SSSSITRIVAMTGLFCHRRLWPRWPGKKSPAPPMQRCLARPPLSPYRGFMIQRFLYRLYERRLLRQMRAGPMPHHVGIILDGNRRHGRAHGITAPRELYGIGAQKLDEILEWCAELSIPAITLWVFSTENFSRPSDEISGIFGAIEAKLAALADHPTIHSQRVRV